MNYLTTENAKTTKGESLGFITGILYLAPARESGAINVCPHASKGCKASCLFTAGRGAFDNVRNARVRKTLEFVEDRVAFVDRLADDILSLIRKAAHEKLVPCVRLNGTSDLPWEKLKTSAGKTLMETFPKIQFYDYTKSAERAIASVASLAWPSNYNLTFSRSETNWADCLNVLRAGGKIAAVFDIARNQELPLWHDGFPVIDGDKSDLRFQDGNGLIVGLRAKGDAKRDTSGFVIRAE
jgi:hypothetical protein